MPSTAHQAMLLWCVRRMAQDGFALTAVDGVLPRAGEFAALPRPPVVHGIRPDAFAQHAQSSLICFGEAKTAADIDTKHTRQQLRILGFAKMRGHGVTCPLYIAIPRSAVYVLDRVLNDLGLLGRSNIRRIHVPETLLAHA